MYTEPMANSVVDPVVVVPYDEAWPSLFEQERACIERTIGPWVEVPDMGDAAAGAMDAALG